MAKAYYTGADGLQHPLRSVRLTGGAGKREVLQVSAFVEGIGYKASHNAQEIKAAWDAGMAIFLRFDAPDGSGEQSYDFQTYKDGLAYFRRPFKGGNQVGRIIITIDDKSNVNKADDFTTVPEIDDSAISSTATWSSQKISEKTEFKKIVPDYTTPLTLATSEDTADFTGTVAIDTDGYLLARVQNAKETALVRSYVAINGKRIIWYSADSAAPWHLTISGLVPVKKGDSINYELKSSGAKALFLYKVEEKDV